MNNRKCSEIGTLTLCYFKPVEIGKELSLVVAIGKITPLVKCYINRASLNQDYIPSPLKGAPYIQKLFFGASDYHIKNS